MTEKSKNSGKKLSGEVIAVMLMFAAIPLIAYIKWNYDDHVQLGAIASFILAASAIMLRHEIEKKKAKASSEEGSSEDTTGQQGAQGAQ